MAKKALLDRDVYTASLARVRELFDRFDRIVVMFSGGKDSTACLNLALQVARERGRLPLELVFFDEEAIPMETVEYVERVAAMPEIDLKWFCLPVKHRNACSRREPWWYCWDPQARDRWVRELPKRAIVEHPRFKMGMSVPEISDLLFGPERGTVCAILGIRADESIRRYRIVSRSEVDNWLTKPRAGYYTRAFPIFDWSTQDVWIAPARFGWDYNRTYDVYDKMGIAPHRQRVCPPFGEEPLQKLRLYQVCFPELWARMIERVHGAATAGRYCTSELYATAKEPPAGMSWREYLDEVLGLYADDDRSRLVDHINKQIKLHNRKSRRSIHDDQPDPISGISWRYLCMIAIRGDFKGRTAGRMMVEAEKAHRREGRTYEEALETDGNTVY